MANERYLHELAGDSWGALPDAAIINKSDANIENVRRYHNVLRQRRLKDADCFAGADTDANEAARHQLKAVNGFQGGVVGRIDADMVRQYVRKGADADFAWSLLGIGKNQTRLQSVVDRKTQLDRVTWRYQVVTRW